MYEKRTDVVLSRASFIRRMVFCLCVGILSIAFSLVIGMLGYHFIEGISIVDAFHQAALVYSGVGANISASTDAGKVFEGLYAMYGALALFIPVTILLAPIVHRFMHKFHVGK